ncbi:putative xylanase/chitin deacetylase [Desulfosporosinus acidiphilus SJ4]|uniref:Putative xylanase/chitin deacetylase n=1 Tax=Desulfosporosinus acidiphilus (strain DSM 22704 / JCM 16185 / SJ4) TaxID=646529 RepID=I4DBA3_DESAJ|nr:polysaccharide deacetylase family protein [Desulfosporosinus acidiphilus]AFM43077.1 putative xylanase/chitin deacetylase [Desulfosporosinus acidiphilus SJ4]
MNLKFKLFLASLCTLVLIIVSFAVKCPAANDYLPGDSLKSNSSKPLVSPAPPSLAVVNQAEPKMTTFPKAGIPVLMYHSIKTLPGNSLGVPVKQFTEEITWLHNKGYHSITTDELYQTLANKAPIPEKPILLTFDDGYSDNYTSAWPILQKSGFRATFFIVTNSVGQGMMSWDQLSDLVKQGNSIGSHTVHHLDLSKLSYNKQENELISSKEALENHLGIKVQALCFPSGKFNKTTLELMAKTGYQLGFTTKQGRVHSGDDLLTLRRERIYGGMPLPSFQKLFP